MNYQLIKIICQQRGVVMDKLIQAIGLTSAGYYLAVKNRPLKKRAKLYTLYFGQSHFIEFQNIRTARDYERQVLNSINAFLRSSNIIFSELFTIYRKLWPALPFTKSGPINIMVQDITENFEKIFSFNDTKVFFIVYKILEDLEKLTLFLEKNLKLKKMYLELYELQTKKGALLSASLKLKIFKSQLKE